LNDIILEECAAAAAAVWCCRVFACVAGLILQFRFFLRNDVGVLLLLFWLFTLALSSFSYFLSVFINRAQSATYTGFAVFLVRRGLWGAAGGGGGG